MPSGAAGSVEHVFRAEYGRAVAVLVRYFGDIDLAEEAVQDAFAVALQRWSADGVPPSPAGCIRSPWPLARGPRRRWARPTPSDGPATTR